MSNNFFSKTKDLGSTLTSSSSSFTTQSKQLKQFTILFIIIFNAEAKRGNTPLTYMRVKKTTEKFFKLNYM